MSERGTYTCHACGDRFESDMTDAEADEEARQIFGESPQGDDKAVVCHDCHLMILANMCNAGVFPDGFDDLETFRLYVIAELDGATA